MPNSLKSRLKKLKYQGLLSEKDLSRLYTDNDVIEELEKIKEEIEEYMIISFCEDDDFKNIRKIIDEHISELKGDKQ